MQSFFFYKQVFLIYRLVFRADQLYFLLVHGPDSPLLQTRFQNLTLWSFSEPLLCLVYEMERQLTVNKLGRRLFYGSRSWCTLNFTFLVIYRKLKTTIFLDLVLI